ncbi:CIC11C00000001018 [Sungouiella intermedia]|uniref:Large ribosomal subunit protein mL49 n=1 Tax=Sungouiella intermedia TaxID=45354 RepID=A0A1L0DGV7_9ASCO|nr:CIC11C00000001018 [[Candida] intermedia]
MKSTTRLLKSARIPKIAHAEQIYKAPSLASISPSELPNNAFENNNLYHIKKTAYGHWPVYKKIQNTRISTEIKRVEGNVSRFAQELLGLIGNVKSNNLKVNTITGEVNIKGDHVEKIKEVLEKHVRY